MVQEALTNVVKHARAERVRLVLREVDGGSRSAIRDDGHGFDAVQPTGGSACWACASGSSWPAAS